MYDIQNCFICRPSDSTVSEDAWIEPRAAVTTALAVRRSNRSARSHPHSARSHPHSARSHPKIDMVWRCRSPIPVAGRRGVISTFK